jgi:hypothetical protein
VKRGNGESMNGWFVISGSLFLLCLFAQGRPSEPLTWLVIFGAACAAGGYGVCYALVERKLKAHKMKKAIR